MPRPRKKTFANIDALMKSMPLPTTVGDDQLRQMLFQLILDYPEQLKPDTGYRLMRNKMDIMRLLYEMNHPKDKDDELSSSLLEALANRPREGS